MIEFYKNKKYKVKTPTGFKDFTGIRRTTKAEVLEILFEDDTKLECSLDHIFIVNGREVLGRDVQIKQKLTASKIVSSITLKPNKGFLYDLVGVEGNSLYIADEIISHNCDFSTSGNTVISPVLLAEILKTTVKEPLYQRGFDNNLWIWSLPDYSKDYIVTADVARGDGSDYSSFHIIDVETVEQVAEYKGQPNTKDFGNMLVSIATEYNDALLVVENANVGWATIQQIMTRGYKNLYYSYKDSVFDSDAFLTKGYDLVNKTDMVAGFTMSHKIRPLAISKLDLYFREKLGIVRSKRLIDELMVFIWKNDKPQAQQGYNDDLVLSYAQGLWVRDTALKLRQAGIELNRMAVSNIKATTAPRTSTNQFTANPWKVETKGGNQEDITWLL